VFSGAFKFKTRPDHIARKMFIDALPGSALVRDYPATTLAEPFIDIRKESRFRGFALHTNHGTNGVALDVNGLYASNSIISELYITSKIPGVMWAIPMALRSADPLGIRGVHVEHVELFAASHALLWLVNVRGLWLEDVNCYPAGGTVSHATIQHSGAYRSAAVKWSTRYLETLYAYNTDNMKIDRINPVAISQSGCTNITQA